MTLTLAEAKVNAMQHIKRYSNSGELIETTDGNYQDLVLRMPPLANSAQMELCKISKIPGKFSISQNPIANQLGLYAFDEVQHYPETDLTYTSTGSKSFSIEVDGDCSIYFDEQISGTWTPLSGTYSLDGGTSTVFTGSIAVTATTFENYKGLLTIASATNSVRMKVVATYPMKSRYRALFAYTYATAQKVPMYKAFVPYDLPTDYMDFDRMMRGFDQRQYQENQDYILTNDNKIHLNYFLTGSFDIYYWKWPTEITNETEDTYVFEVNKDAQAAIPYYMGGYAIYPTNQNLGVQLLNQYYALRDMLNTPKTNITNEVQNTLWATRVSLLDKLRT
jgi:hypothetical protein